MDGDGKNRRGELKRSLEAHKRRLIEGLRPNGDALCPNRDEREETRGIADDELHGMRRADLRRVNEALARLENGLYGRCGQCGEEIARERLEAMPFAVRCKGCEEGRETALQRAQLTRRSSSRF